MPYDRGAPVGFPPARFDDYRVVGPLGAGGMGTVFLGHDHMLDRRVALKFIASVAPDARSRERFLQEARAIARLHHPNVVGVYRIGTVESRPYLAYELVDGQPLHRLPWPLPWRRVLRLGLGLARGLAAVHAAAVLHRDIKPANVVVATGDVAKLIDFGLASRLDAAPAAPPTGAALGEAATHPDATSAVPLAGTPAYMAPELWAGAAPSAASDVFALGLVLWQMLTGELPHDGLATEAMILAVRSRAIPSIGERCPDLPQPFADLIDACVARAPEDRPGSAAVRDRLETIRAVYAPLVDDAAQDDAGARDADALAESFARATADPDRFSTRFYENVFTIAPDLRELFPTDIGTLRVKLVSTLQTVVRNARAPERLVPLLEDLGARHHGYGVRPGNFEVMGQALLATLGELEGDRWDAAAEVLWTHAYQHLAEHMTRGLVRAARGSTPRAAPPLTRVPLAPPEPRFVASRGATIGYQVFGAGKADLLVIPPWFGHLELAWQEPGYATLLSRLAQIARVLVFDRRGSGLSDRAPAGIALHDHVADALAVLDAAGAERASLLACGDATTVAACLAATHPERVRSLVLYGGSPWHQAPEPVDDVCDAIRARWGEPLFLDEQAPSRRGDEVFRAWWARQLRSAISPTMAATVVRTVAAVDVRPALAAVQAPTLILQRRGDRPHVLAGGRAFRDGIRGAHLLELDGTDHLVYSGDPEPVVREVETLLRDAPTATAMPARLLAVLAVRSPDDADVAPLRAAIEREGGVLVEDGPALAASFDLPDPALRVLATAPAGARAAIHTAAVRLDRDGENELTRAALTAAIDSPPGTVRMDAASAALAGAPARELAIG